ncbi:protein EPIDERMAL PATTERNING FACTOR 2 [Corylus avellana]|uniref:protein EPIDERMAL PATTERNING FACTOR 2 n=1 Tax=Corylus avellana TaxID=13451 RepID=UPI00286B562E|nr:protein EPIDERMAL PATTERNING FACTOR 2 [Corylus avellana]
MKGFVCASVLVILLLFVPEVMSLRHLGRPLSRHHDEGHTHYTEGKAKDGLVAKPNSYTERRPMKRKVPDPLQIAGSSLPDCSHACGSCSPCRLVMVSFVCASLQEAETCPMAYKCMCNNKSYPVP